MTDQRERVSTDPGIGPVDVDNNATLRSIEAAIEVEPDGASLYYEPVPLVAVSDHRTLEIETVKLSQEIDPRKLPTLNLPRSPLPPPYDSSWPQADLVLTSSQRPTALERRWRVPAVLLAVPVAVLLLVLVCTFTQRTEPSAANSLQREAATAPSPVARPTLPIFVASATLPVASATLPVASAASTARAALAPNAPPKPFAPATAGTAPQHPTPPSAEPSASNGALGSLAPKPKRAIY